MLPIHHKVSPPGKDMMDKVMVPYARSPAVSRYALLPACVLDIERAAPMFQFKGMLIEIICSHRFFTASRPIIWLCYTIAF